MYTLYSICKMHLTYYGMNKFISFYLHNPNIWLWQINVPSPSSTIIIMITLPNVITPCCNLTVVSLSGANWFSRRSMANTTLIWKNTTQPFQGK